MPVSGITEIDTEFERVGFLAAERLFQLFDATFLLVCIGVASLAYLVHRGAQQGSFRECVVYLFYLAGMAFLLGRQKITFVTPNGEKPLEAPRVLVWMNTLTDRITRALAGDYTKLRRDLEEDRRMKVFVDMTITDSSLQLETRRYLTMCWAPAVTRLANQGLDTDPHMYWPLRLNDFGDRDDCRRRRDALERRLQEYVRAQYPVLMALNVPRDESGLWKNVAALDRALHDVRDPGVMMSLTNALVRRELSGASDLALVQEVTRDDRPDPKAKGGLEWYVQTWEKVYDWGYSLIGGMKTAFDARGQAIAQRYLIMRSAPYFYGFCVMLALAAFPIAAAYTIVPGRWTALVHFFKIFVSIKLWPVFWHLLYTFKHATGDLDAHFVLPSVYVVIPTISFVLVNTLSQAAAVSVQSTYSSDGGAHLILQTVQKVAAAGIRAAGRA